MMHREQFQNCLNVIRDLLAATRSETTMPLVEAFDQLRAHNEAMSERIVELQSQESKELAELRAIVDRLREELIDALSDVFFENSMLEPDRKVYSHDVGGWYVTNATTTAVSAGDRLVELGAFEKHPADIGGGRVQWYRPKQAAEAAKKGVVDAAHIQNRSASSVDDRSTRRRRYGGTSDVRRDD